MIQPKSNWDEAVSRLSIDAAKKAQRAERAEFLKRTLHPNQDNGFPCRCSRCDALRLKYGSEAS